MNSFTLEVSFLGPNRGENAGMHFNPAHLQRLGRVFCQSLVDYVEDTERVARVFGELKSKYAIVAAGGARQSNQFNNKTDEENGF